MYRNISKLINLNKYSKIGILVDKNVERLFLKNLIKSLNKNCSVIIINSNEDSKNIHSVQKILKKLFIDRFDRKSLFINFGGGVITDIGGFAAGIYMRGIAYINIPTTLLAQVDASIGGKTGVNFNNTKNSIGLFNQPIMVISDVSFISTLPKKQIISGFAEIIKHAIIYNASFFNYISSKNLNDFSNIELVDIIYKSCKIKSEIVANDYQEKGYRKILNFGHTIGHALESLSLKTNKIFTHGEAVILGMLAESSLALFLGLLSQKDFKRIESLLIKINFNNEINFSSKEIYNKILLDKKNEFGDVLWSLPDKIGSCLYNIKSPKKIIIKAIETIL